MSSTTPAKSADMHLHPRIVVGVDHDDELAAFRDLAAAFLAYDDGQLRLALDSNVLTEVMCHGQQDVPQ